MNIHEKVVAAIISAIAVVVTAVAGFGGVMYGNMKAMERFEENVKHSVLLDAVQTYSDMFRLSGGAEKSDGANEKEFVNKFRKATMYSWDGLLVPLYEYRMAYRGSVHSTLKSEDYKKDVENFLPLELVDNTSIKNTIAQLKDANKETRQQVFWSKRTLLLSALQKRLGNMLSE